MTLLGAETRAGWMAAKRAAMTMVGYSEANSSILFVHKLDQVNLLAGAVLCSLEQIDHAGKTGAAGQLGRNVVQVI